MVRALRDRENALPPNVATPRIAIVRLPVNSALGVSIRFLRSHPSFG